jgi:hypothetical protein
MSDEVYVAIVPGAVVEDDRAYVFGHLSDATAFAATKDCVVVRTAKVLDHADARALIEQEEGD